MEIKSKSGHKFEVELSGTRERHFIKVLPFNALGRTIKGEATIGRFNRDDSDRGLFIAGGFIRCENTEIAKIEHSIEDLSPQRYYARKTKELINADGENVSIEKWHFDKMMQTPKGTVIMEPEMAAFLDAKNITEIELGTAIKMWSEEREDTHIAAERHGTKYTKAIFEEDEMEVGYEQACENMGIPRFLR